MSEGDEDATLIDRMIAHKNYENVLQGAGFNSPFLVEAIAELQRLEEHIDELEKVLGDILNQINNRRK